MSIITVRRPTTFLNLLTTQRRDGTVSIIRKDGLPAIGPLRYLLTADQLKRKIEKLRGGA